jgi:hypothetical protein
MAEMTTSHRPILVTGAHRSGSTWVGSMLAASPAVGHIHEPFNLNCRPGTCGARFHLWFTYVTEENQSTVYKHIDNTLRFRFDLRAEARTIRSLAHARRAGAEYLRCLRRRISRARPLMKDPIAVFSAEWLASAFDMQVVVLIRHPAAFASSLKKLGWTHPFSHFIQQPALMKDHLQPFRDEIEEYAQREHDIVDQAALLWRLIYHVVSNYRQEHKDWTFVRHEDLSRDPVREFEMLYNELKLEWSEDTMRVVRSHSDESNPSEAPPVYQYLKRNSKSNIWNWKQRLTKAEIERLRAQVEDVSQLFYSNEDW